MEDLNDGAVPLDASQWSQQLKVDFDTFHLMSPLVPQAAV